MNHEHTYTRDSRQACTQVFLNQQRRHPDASTTPRPVLIGRPIMTSCIQQTRKRQTWISKFLHMRKSHTVASKSCTYSWKASSRSFQISFHLFSCLSLPITKQKSFLKLGSHPEPGQYQNWTEMFRFSCSSRTNKARTVGSRSAVVSVVGWGDMRQKSSGWTDFRLFAY
jgi:hypothetical protein